MRTAQQKGEVGEWQQGGVGDREQPVAAVGQSLRAGPGHGGGDMSNYGAGAGVTWAAVRRVEAIGPKKTNLFEPELNLALASDAATLDRGTKMMEQNLALLGLLGRLNSSLGPFPTPPRLT